MYSFGQPRVGNKPFAEAYGDTKIHYILLLMLLSLEQSPSPLIHVLLYRPHGDVLINTWCLLSSPDG